MPQLPLSRRGATIGAGAVALCLCSGLCSTGVAFADTPLPPLPSATDVLSTTQQAVTTVLSDPSSAPAAVGTVTGAATGTVTSTPAAATPGSTTPSTVPATSTTLTSQKTARRVASPRLPHAAKAAPRHTSHASHVAVRAAAPETALTTWYAAAPAALRLPPATAVDSAPATSQAPAVAPLIVDSPAHAVTAATSHDLTGHDGAALRALLVAAALAAAGALGAGHMWQLRRRLA